MPTLKRWYVVPQSGGFLVGGEVYGHDSFEDGDPIKTSLVASRRRRLITTRTGTRYILDGECLNPEVMESLSIPKLSLK